MRTRQEIDRLLDRARTNRAATMRVYESIESVKTQVGDLVDQWQQEVESLEEEWHQVREREKALDSTFGLRTALDEEEAASFGVNTKDDYTDETDIQEES